MLGTRQFLPTGIYSQSLTGANTARWDKGSNFKEAPKGRTHTLPRHGL